MSKFKKKNTSPWPTKAAMEQVYEQHLWGGDEHDFYSGEGSHRPEIIEPYLKEVTSFLKSHQNKLSVCDLGCGDFNIGQQLLPYTSSYIAIDIVKDLISRNKIKFKNDDVEFHCLDIAKDELPKADCAIIRQVLQHLSNTEIKAITKKLSNYKYVILTEHIPIGDFIPNIDIISGQGIRLKHRSGVDILGAPFNFKVKSSKLLTEVLLGGKKGKIASYLIEL
ncbi:class I SAM-dependent methyltransferase [Winogradskyella tangerina]|uniref:class I SAM-dependent methyltransferase n=1 Tax=Winogradskyella tangerina TaxID=2023240 RepID=UPI000DBE6201|nr:class I SAM-dependent methyltransferase [Winogradskyella tangerina]